MQYVGRFVSSVYNTITPNINPATLSGAIDVIVVEREEEVEEDITDDEDQQDGSHIGIGATSIQQKPKEKRKRKVKKMELASTPFHVRFGKMSVLRPGERKVTLHLNNSSEPLPFAMKVGEQGEAFFVVEVDEEADNIPDNLVTSPILSPTTSPGVGATGPEAMAGSGDVEPLELGDSQFHQGQGAQSPGADTETDSAFDARSAGASTLRSNTTDNDTAITTPGQSRSGSTDAGSRTPSKDAEEAPSDVPEDSQRSGSGPTVGVLGQIGNAASKAGGAIGAAGRAIGGRSDNPRTDKLASQAAKGDPVEGQTGAPVDQNKSPDAEQYHPQQHNPPGKQRQQEADDKEPTPPLSDAEKLEKGMRDRAEKLLVDEQEALQIINAVNDTNNSDNSTTSSPKLDDDADEEAYPAPFGGVSSGTSDHPKRSGSNTFPVAQHDHGDFIAGTKLAGLDQKQSLPFKPASIDPRTVQSRIDTTKAGHEAAARSSAPSSEEQVTSHGMLRSQSKSDKEKHVPDEEVAQKAPQRKEDLQYMLDMDGYKMTPDGEDLAFAEGHRLAEELPLSRRHGGKEFHPHIGELLDQAHRRERAGLANVPHDGDNQYGAAGSHVTSTDDSALDTGRVSAPPGSTADAHDDLMTIDPTAHAFGARSSRVQQEDAALGRDLARAARLLRPQGDADDGDSDATNSANGAAGTSSSHRRVNRVRRRLQDVSLSDTEADLPGEEDSGEDDQEEETWRTRKTHMRAKSGPFDYSTGSTGAEDEDEADSSVNANASSKFPPRGEPGSRQRVQSHSAGDGLTSGPGSVDQLPQAIRSGVNLPRFCGMEDDAYTFLFIADDGAKHSFEMSLCYKDGFGTDQNIVDDGPSEEEEFEESRVSFHRFVHDPDVVNDERLVILYKERYLTWENASTILATLSYYRHSFAAARGEDGTSKAQAVAASDGSRASVWSRWWYRNRNNSTVTPPVDRPGFAREASAPPEEHPPQRPPALPHGVERAQTDSQLLPNKGSLSQGTDQSDNAGSASAANAQPRPSQKPGNASKSNKTYAKTLRLTSDQLKSLNLKKGANTITFSVTSSYSGVATCTARIFLWESTHHIVVSDIDGTITKSDALGHVFTMIGRDWTHLGVAKLYTDIARNGYRIMYLTSRAIGQADTTRDYLRGISQNNYRLPDGPVIMSPDRLIASLHREVILRKPEVFKMACLRDIARLFGADPRKAHPQPTGAELAGGNSDEVKKAIKEVETGAGKEGSPSDGAATAASNAATPFYAGFGNRITDALSYRSVNIPSSRIFTIDTNGEVKMELLELAGYKSSYIHMTDLVDQMFPPITNNSSAGKVGKPEYNDFNFWRPQISSTFELPSDDELMPSPPVSPALSARSGRSIRSQASVKSSSAADTEQQQGRLSRFGLGSLGLSRKPSAQTVDASDPSAQTSKSGRNGPHHSATVTSEAELKGAHGLQQTSSESHLPLDHLGGPHRNNSAPAEAGPDGNGLSSSYGSGSSSWIAPWRRRAASPSSTPTTSNAALSPPQATSPLVGPVITAEPDSDDDEYAEGEDDDDVSSFGGHDRDGDDDDDDQDDDEYHDGEGGDDSLNSSTNSQRRRPRSRREPSDFGDNVLEDDELLATGEVQFDWRG
ncbi:unnamed protein product [Sympodiomycopsis kandeliae]